MNAGTLTVTGLGYGAGFFDRTLASLDKRPITHRSLPRARAARHHLPQPWDIPMDYVVTERRRLPPAIPKGSLTSAKPQRGEGSKLASPVCYADEVKPRLNEEQPVSRVARFVSVRIAELCAGTR